MAFDPIIAGERVGHFLSDELIQQVFHERKIMYFNQWLATTSPEERERVFAETKAFESLGVALQAVVDAGVQERALPALERRGE